MEQISAINGGREPAAVGGAAHVGVVNRGGGGAFLLVCEHASNYIPPEYGDLGLAAELLDSHIAWDPGAADLGREMSALLDSPLVLQGVSRLVVDCNRPPMSDGATPAKSEIYFVPGNAELSAEERRRRARRYYDPFCETLSALLRERGEDGLLHALLTVHSFSPVYYGERRDTGVGLIDHGDPRLADALFGRLRRAAADNIVVRRNAPYSRRDGVTHTLSLHAAPRALPHVMIEVRNDLLAAAEQRAAMARRLADSARAALAELVPAATPEARA